MGQIPKAVLVIPVWILATLLATAVATPAVADSASCLAPSGGDDTAALQAALDGCSGARRPCSVRLCAGAFDTGILRVKDFRGTLRGAGALATVLRARPDLDVNPNLQGFFRDGPFGASPWPYLLQFVEGEATIRDLGILVPTPPAGSRPTTGWTLLGGFDTIFELRGALLLTGREPAAFAVRRVRVTAEPDPASELATTAFHGIEFGGLLFDPAAPEPFPVFPARGRFELSASRAQGVLSGAALGELARAHVLVAHNRFRSAVAVELIDADRSQVAIVSNRWHVSYRGVQVLQNLDGAPSRATGILVDGNRGSLDPFFQGIGDGISFQDPIDATPDPGGSVLWATRNRLVLGSAARPVTSGISVRGAAWPKLVDNRLSGAAGTGLEVDVTSRCLVLGNAFRGLATGGGPDLHLGPDTSDCVAIVDRRDQVLDDGVDNRVIISR